MSGLRQAKTDAELWELIRQDHAPSFRALYERYWSALFTTAYSWIPDREACSTIVHDIFLDCWMRRKELEIGSFYHYLTAAARYRVYKNIQQKVNLKIIHVDPQKESNTQPVYNSGEYEMRYRELQDTVEASLQNLPDRCREIFHMSRKEQMSIAEIAESLGISRRTVENQLTRALQHLRQSLSQFHLDLFILGFTLLALY